MLTPKERDEMREWLRSSPTARLLLLGGFAREARASVDLDKGELHTCHSECEHPACVARREREENK